MIIVWRSHCDKRKEIAYNDFPGVVIVSSNSQAHNDDCRPRDSNNKEQMGEYGAPSKIWAATQNGPSPATGRLDYLGTLTFQPSKASKTSRF